MEALLEVLTSRAVVSGALAGSASGVLGTFFAPWVHWGIEKRRLQLERRQKLIDDFREALANHEGDILDFVGTTEYFALRDELGAEARDKIEDAKTFYAVDDPGTEPRRRMLLEEVSRIERKWDLLD